MENLGLLRFLEPAGTAIQALPQTAWGGHIPFMFCLMSYLRPRNYVELGTHNGASFFAVCQAIQQFGIECKPTAIDLWSGDEHAGKYDESVYKVFLDIRQNKFGGIGDVLRKDFDDASNYFADRSLDLIHIDGLHTYAAVRNDYERWFPKVAESGVLLFHDTSVRDRDFGVWKFWDEIKDTHISFNFTHTHGLGVIALGSEASNPLIPLLQEVNSSETTKSSFDNFFRLIGERAVSEAITKNKLDKARNKFPKSIKKYFRSLGLNKRRLEV